MKTSRPPLPRVARALADIAQAMSGVDRPDARVTAVLKHLAQLVPYERCAMLHGAAPTGHRELFALPELPAERVPALRKHLGDLMELLGESDAGPEPTSSRSESTRRTHLAVPVMGLNGAVGVLFVERDGPDRYDEDSLRLLSVVAAHLGSYLTTVRLREEEIERARQLGMALQRLEETDRRKDEFLAMLGHELRNPLGAINSALRVLDHTGAEDGARYHALIDRQIRHLSRIVDDLLDASRVRLGKIILERQLVDLRDIATRWFEAFGPTGLVQSHDVKLTLPAEPVIVEGDPVRLEQVFSNLLTNALKYTPSGGFIRVAVAPEGSNGVIRVEDSGIGMTPELLRSAFELFTQADDSLSRSQGGLGLGLPLVRSLIEKHGGSVEGSSPGLGKGSAFIVRLPLASASDAPSVPREADGPASNAAPLRVLVVEDNTDSCDMLRELLRIWGHDVDTAADGLDGASKALSGVYDVALVDIGLPGLDGYQVARRVRDRLGERAPCLIAMTGYGQPEDRRRATDSGFDGHTVKPVDAAGLRKRLSLIAPRAAKS